MALVLLSLGLIHLTSVLGRSRPGKNHVAFHFGTAALVLILGAVGHLRPVMLMGLLALVCAFQVVLEIVSPQGPDQPA